MYLVRCLARKCCLAPVRFVPCHVPLLSQPGETVVVRSRSWFTDRPELVPEGHVWLEGDNPSNSSDSRSYGPIPLAMVRGRVFFKVTLSGCIVEAVVSLLPSVHACASLGTRRDVQTGCPESLQITEHPCTFGHPLVRYGTSSVCYTSKHGSDPLAPFFCCSFRGPGMAPV